MTTPNLQLPEVPRAILGASDELNDAFWSLDAIVQLAVKDKDLTTPPLDATQGDRFIVPSGAIGSWAGRDRAIAYLGPNGYLFYPPRPGWRARVLDEEAWYVYTDNAEWELEVSGGGGGGGGSSHITPDTRPETPDPADDEFEDGTTIDTGGARDGGGHTAWSWTNQGSATADLSSGALILTAPASASESFRIVEQPAPVSSTWRYRAKVMAHYNLSNYAYCGFTLRNSVNGRLIYFGLTYVGGHFLYAQRWDSPTSFAVNIAGIGIAPSGFVPIYLEVENTGTDLVLRYSHHGYDGTFHTHSTEPIATFITNAPDFIGLTANSQNSNIVRTCVDWFRRMA